MKITTKTLTRTALLLALALLFQSLRYIPGFGTNDISRYVIGTLVNMVLIFAAYKISLPSAIFISLATPLIAFLQGHIVFPILVPITIAGNIIFVVLFYFAKKLNKYAAVTVAAFAKWITMYYSGFLLLPLFIPQNSVTPALYALSIPQLVTALIGGFIALLLAIRIKLEDKN